MMVSSSSGTHAMRGENQGYMRWNMGVPADNAEACKVCSRACSYQYHMTYSVLLLIASIMHNQQRISPCIERRWSFSRASAIYGGSNELCFPHAHHMCDCSTFSHHGSENTPKRSYTSGLQRRTRPPPPAAAAISLHFPRQM